MLRLTRTPQTVITAILTTFVMTGPLTAQDEAIRVRVRESLPATPAAQKPDSQTTVFKLRNLTASEFAESLARSLGERGIEIVAEPTTNSLLITASPEALSKVASLVKALDQPAAMINVDVSLVQLGGEQGAIAEAIQNAGPASAALVADLVRSGKVRILNRMRVTALENTQARVHSQEQKSVPSGRVFAGSRGGTRTTAQAFEERETGTMIIVRPKKSGESEITLDLQLESTRLEKPTRDSAVEEADTPVPPRMLTTSIQTTVRIPQGKSVLIQAATRQDGDSSHQFAVLLNATIGTAYANPPTTESPKAAGQQNLDPAGKTVVIYLRNAAAADAKKVVVEVYRDFADKLNITADERTNALFIRGDDETTEQIEALLKVLDSADPKVKPEVQIKEIQDALRGALPRAINSKKSAN